MTRLKLVEVAREITVSILGENEISQYVRNNIKMVTTNSNSVKDILVNNRDYARLKFYKCTDLCLEGKHFAMNLADMEVSTAK